MKNMKTMIEHIFSGYERIGLIAIGALLMLVLALSLNEFSGESDFDASIGRTLQIGLFSTLRDQDVSDTIENDCEQFYPVIVTALHDIKEHLEHMKKHPLFSSEEPFEVNQDTLTVFCHTEASITLGDGTGRELILEKSPFVRDIPRGGGPDDIGTRVHIDATVVAAGADVPPKPTTYADVLIPDRFLERVSE